MNTTKASKFLSLILRHDPGSVGIALDSAGWVRVDVLLAACAKHGHPLTRAEFDEIVETNSKKRRLGLRTHRRASARVDLRRGSLAGLRSARSVALRDNIGRPTEQV